MERGDTGMLAAPPTNSGLNGKVDGDTVSRFATCCRALGIAIYERQRPADLAAARSGFTELTRIAYDQCDAWTGLAGGGDVSLRVLEAVSRTATTAGRLQRQVELAPGALGFRYDTGLYLQFRASSPDEFHLAYAAALATAGRFAEADRIITGLTKRRPSWREARWVTVVVNYRAERWSDVVKLLTPIVNDSDLDGAFSHAAKITLGTALARLGMFAPALSYLEEPDGPVARRGGRRRAGQSARPACARRRGLGKRGAAGPLRGPSGERTGRTCAVRHQLWDRDHHLGTGSRRAPIRGTANTEPSRERLRRPVGAHERKGVLLHEAERQLAEFIGLDEVKNQVSRLKSSVAMELVRKQRGLAVAQRAHHLVFAGPPGTGKTTIARVVAKIYCGLGLLKRENIREVHRADLIGQHIGETEAKTNAIIDSALDGVLFLDEAYALVATGAKNDFGLVAIDTLLARMENDRDRLVVIIAGYRADLDSSSTPTRVCGRGSPATSTFPSYNASELVEIANYDGPTARQHLRAVRARPLWRRCSTDWPRSTHPIPTGIERRSLDIAGNGRFVRNIVERSEEEREFRLDHSEQAGTGEFSDDELMTITDQDVSNSVEPLLRGLGLSVPA